MRRELGVAWTTMVISLLGVGSAASQTEDEWIVFGSFRGGDFSGSIHAIRADGSAERELSLHRGGRPASLDPWSAPDGAAVLFTRGGPSHRSAVWSLDPLSREESPLTAEVMVRFDNGRAWPSLRPGYPGEFSFVREVDGERRVVLGSLTEDVERVLGPGEFPAWSPDGSALAYVREGTVWVLRLGDGEARPLRNELTTMSHPAWSPRGESLLVSGHDGEGVDLYEVGTDGGGLARLTHSPDIVETAAQWSPDGRRVAFSAPAAQPADGWQHSIYVLHVPSGSIREITSGRFHDTRPTWTTGAPGQR